MVESREIEERDEAKERESGGEKERKRKKPVQTVDMQVLRLLFEDNGIFATFAGIQ